MPQVLCRDLPGTFQGPPRDSQAPRRTFWGLRDYQGPPRDPLWPSGTFRDLHGPPGVRQGPSPKIVGKWEILVWEWLPVVSVPLDPQRFFNNCTELTGPALYNGPPGPCQMCPPCVVACQFQTLSVRVLCSHNSFPKQVDLFQIISVVV